MSESIEEDYQILTPLTPVLRRRTFDTCTAQVLIPTEAKRKLSKIYENLIVPKGTYDIEV